MQVSSDPTTNKTGSLKCKKAGQNKHLLQKPHSPLKKPRLTVSSDSQGRNLALFLEHQNKNFTIFNKCLPGATLQPNFEAIISSPDFKTNSKAECQTNEISNYRISNVQELHKNLIDYIEKQLSAFEHTNLIMSTIPDRYGINEESIENRLTKQLNQSIRNMAYNKSEVKYTCYNLGYLPFSKTVSHKTWTTH